MHMEPDILQALIAALQAEPRRLPPEAAPARAAVAAVLREGSGEPELLFIQRAERPGDPWSGQMAFPGGRVDPSDPHEQAAAERETEEEVGLRLAECGALLGRLDEIQARARGGRLPLGIAPFVYWLHSPVEACLSCEVQQIVWIPLIELFNPANRHSLDYPMDGQVRRLPAIEFQHKVVWGLTLAIVGDLLERLSRGPAADWARKRLGLAEDRPLMPEWRSLVG
jgi:8-oxo-dGTP pyrophosphatase MutT (NUDIX family)